MDKERLLYLLQQYIGGKATRDEEDELFDSPEFHESDETLTNFLRERWNSLPLKFIYRVIPATDPAWDKMRAAMQKQPEKLKAEPPLWKTGVKRIGIFELVIKESDMLKNYFRVAWRNLLKSKIYSAINIAGLATGMAVALLIGLWISEELSFDTYHRNHARLAQVMDTQIMNDKKSTSEEIAVPLRNELAAKYGDRFKDLALTSQAFPTTIKAGEKKIIEAGMFAQAGFPSMLTLKRVAGSLDGLNDPSSILVSQSLAKALFGNSVFKKYDPGSPFDYQFTDEEYAKKFSDEERIGSLATFFAALAILISCLGLFGMASFVAEQRTREIGVRKILGASVVSLWGLLSREFVALVIISCLIASPIAWYALHQWLQKYEYHIVISGWIFAAAGIGALLIALLTISYQAIKAALANPVKSLRTD